MNIGKNWYDYEILIRFSNLKLKFYKFFFCPDLRKGFDRDEITGRVGGLYLIKYYILKIYFERAEGGGAGGRRFKAEEV